MTDEQDQDLADKLMRQFRGESSIAERATDADDVSRRHVEALLEQGNRKLRERQEAREREDRRQGARDRRETTR